MTVSPFASRSGLEQRFADGLLEMLARHENLGVYILVLANAVQDAALWERLRGDLANRHHLLANRVVGALRDGRRVDEPDDDLTVFLKLLAIGFEQIAPIRQRSIPGTGAPAWEAQFNAIRALRPARMSHARVEGVMRAFDRGGFHFNKPFLAREICWEGNLEGRPARLLYNKFPFAPLHGLLVPEPAAEHPQFLTPALHAWAWQVTRAAGSAIPGFGLSYNSYGAFASVNHLHFQTFVREHPLPAQTGPEGGYPLTRWHFSDPAAAWAKLDELHGTGRVYNLVYAASGLLVIPRARQGETPVEPWSAGFAWSEVAGVFPVASRDEYENLDHAALSSALARLAG